jgi:hypothetical protein
LIAPAQGADSDKLVGAVDDGLGYRSGLPCEDALGLAEVTAYFLPKAGDEGSRAAVELSHQPNHVHERRVAARLGARRDRGAHSCFPVEAAHARADRVAVPQQLLSDPRGEKPVPPATGTVRFFGIAVFSSFPVRRHLQC